MKRVKVSTVAAPIDPGSVLTAERLYTVTLGNHVVVRFASERHALAFQADTTRYLSDVLAQVNLMLMDAYAAYRMAWPYFKPGDTKVSRSMRIAEEALDRAALGSETQNAVFFQWKALNEALSQVRTVAMTLEHMYRAKRIGVQRTQMAVMLRRVTELTDALKQYGTDVDTSKGYRPNPYL